MASRSISGRNLSTTTEHSRHWMTPVSSTRLSSSLELLGFNGTAVELWIFFACFSFAILTIFEPLIKKKHIKQLIAENVGTDYFTSIYLETDGTSVIIRLLIAVIMIVVWLQTPFRCKCLTMSDSSVDISLKLAEIEIKSSEYLWTNVAFVRFLSCVCRFGRGQ